MQKNEILVLWVPFFKAEPLLTHSYSFKINIEHTGFLM